MIGLSSAILSCVPRFDLPVNASGDQIVLASGDLRLTVVTAGGGMRELKFGDWSVLDGYGIDELPPGAAGQPLIPWPNRIADGRYEFQGRRYQLPITEPGQDNAVHGFARWMPWNVERASATRATLSLLLYPRAGYPFALYAEVEYTAHGSGVDIVTTARNVGRSPLPYASGFHPYICAGSQAIDSCWLEIPARTWLRTNERQIPVARENVSGNECDFRSRRIIGSTRLDTAYTDLSRDPDGMARVRLSASDGSRSVAVRMDMAYGYVMAYTGDMLTDPARRRRAIAIEPMTAAPNAFQTGDGLQVLEPGETFTSGWGIELEPAIDSG